MRGRKPKPGAVRIAEGKVGHRPIPPEPELPPIKDEPPMKLTAKARAIWDKLNSILEKTGVLKETDAFILASFCDVWAKASTMKDIRDRLACVKEARMLAASLGLSPTDRARLGIKDAQKKDAMAEFEEEGDELRAKSKNIIQAREKFGS